MRLALLFALAVACCAQDRFYLTGAVFNPTAHPELTGVAAIAIPLDAGSQNLSYTSYDVTARKLGATLGTTYSLQTSVRTGFATQVKAIGRLRLYALIDGGYAQVNSSAGGAFGGGFVLSCPLGKNWKIIPAYRILKTSVAPGSPKDFVLAIGRTF